MESAPGSHYEVLGICPRATPEEIETAYRFTLELYGDGALATYSLLDPDEVRRARGRVQEAYEVLRDPARRQAYDASHGLAAPAVARPAPVLAPSNVRAWPGVGGRAAAPGPAPVPLPAPVPAPVPVLAPVPVPASGPQVVASPPPAPAPTAAAAPAPSHAACAVARPRTPHVLAEPVTGAVLRRYREERGVSLREIANQSKVGTRYLQYIEGDRLDMLPAPVYLRGFLQEYARALGLDPRQTANAYMAQFPRPWPES